MRSGLSRRRAVWRGRETARSRWRRHELRQSHQIVSGGCEGEGPSDAVAATEAGLVLAGNHLDPAERFLNALADRSEERRVGKEWESRWAEGVETRRAKKQ